MTLALVLMTGLFITDNSEFFATVEQNIQDGYTWEYVGKQDPDGHPAITVLDSQNKEVIYYKMTK